MPPRPAGVKPCVVPPMRKQAPARAGPPILGSMPFRPLGRVDRNAEGPALLESFFVAAVASFLGIRFFVSVTGYPQIGSSGLHIAHMLWGGLLMLLAIVLLLTFLD